MKINIGIIGLGYVGLPLAIEFSKKYNTVGFDINDKRVEELNKFIDKTLEIKTDILKDRIGNNLQFVNNVDHLKNCNYYILTVPTPVDNNNSPDFSPLISATKLVAEILKKNDVVIIESTVYPGATEEICVPALEAISGLKFNKDFYMGYSPERINPGDKINTLTNIVKVTSGSTIKIANDIDNLYKSIIKAGTYKATSIKVAEAAKVIENSQRDINIAFVNELSKIFNLMGIDTNEVIDTACSKWNFLNFRPGLVGGHCIGVDPYYLAQKAKSLGYNPEIILSGRRLNDSMGKYIATQFIKLMILKNISIQSSNILILGFAFKENCPDYRNTKVIDIINELKTYNVNLTIVDPWVNKLGVENEYNINIHSKIPSKLYDAVLVAVSHKQYINININKYLLNNNVIYDVKGCLDKKNIDLRL
jgi:UDP-N-acetyl-D-galactosamine dehydrogenase